MSAQDRPFAEVAPRLAAWHAGEHSRDLAERFPGSWAMNRLTAANVLYRGRHIDGARYRAFVTAILREFGEACYTVGVTDGRDAGEEGGR